MAVHANSTTALRRPLLPEAAAASRSFPADQPSPADRGALLAILDAGPIDPGSLAALSRSRRRSAQHGISALIDALDALDAAAIDLEPDPDLEDGGDDEHSLGSPEVGHVLDYGYGRVLRGGTLDQARWAMGARCQFTSEAEVVDEDGGDINDVPHDGDGEDLEDGGDKEPALGWTEGMSLDQRWKWGSQLDDAEQGETRPRKRRVRYTDSPGSMAARVARQVAAHRQLPPAELNLREIRRIGFAL